MKNLFQLFLSFIIVFSVASCGNKNEETVEFQNNEVEVVVENSLLRIAGGSQVIAGNGEEVIPGVAVQINGSGKYNREVAKGATLDYYLTPGYKLLGWTVRESKESQKQITPLNEVVSWTETERMTLVHEAEINFEKYNNIKRLYVSAVFEQLEVDFSFSPTFKTTKSFNKEVTGDEALNMYSNINRMIESWDKFITDIKGYPIPQSWFHIIRTLQEDDRKLTEDPSVDHFRAFYNTLNFLITEYPEFSKGLNVLAGILPSKYETTPDVDPYTEEYCAGDICGGLYYQSGYAGLLYTYAKSFNEAFVSEMNRLKTKVPNWESLIK